MPYSFGPEPVTLSPNMELTLDRDPAARLLDMPVRELKLTLAGSPVEPLTKRLLRELRAAGLKKFTPQFYLTDEWGCPSGEPIIGIPFYLADRALMRFERRMHDLESPREIMMYLRHEAGHAFNYAYRLYQTPEWRASFGPFRRPYKDDYKPVPFSRSFVRYLPGWYAQKHPDEDFAETFAVWLTHPGWRKRYEKWPALAKLEYVERVTTEVANKDPVARKGRPDITADEMDQTVRQMFEETAARNRTALELKAEDELADIFLERDPKRKNARNAWQIVAEHRQPLTDAISHWTGVRREVIRGMVDATIEALRTAGYQGHRGREKEYLVRLTAYGTALAFSYFSRGKLHNL